MFLNLLILSVILVAFAFIGLAINILFKKDGKFPETGIGHNPEMTKRGLKCAKTEALQEFQMQKRIFATKGGQNFDSANLNAGCGGCSCS